MSKIGLCFLSYGDIDQQTVWTGFLKDIEFDKYAIFIHRADGGRGTWMPNATLIPTRKTEWGSFSLVEAQQDLFNEAFKDKLISKIVLLSGDTIPLYTFAIVYEYLMRDDKGFLETEACNITHTSRERTTVRRLWPAGKTWAWRVASQWVVLNRTHVKLLQDNWTLLSVVFGTSSVPDEHMYVVFFNGFGCNNTFHRYSVMSVNWKNTSGHCSINHRPLPQTHHVHDFTQEYINSVYETGALFLRKICPLATLTYDWSIDKPLIPSTSLSTEDLIKRPSIRRLMRAKRGPPLI